MRVQELLTKVKLIKENYQKNINLDNLELSYESKPDKVKELFHELMGASLEFEKIGGIARIEKEYMEAAEIHRNLLEKVLSLKDGFEEKILTQHYFYT